MSVMVTKLVRCEDFPTLDDAVAKAKSVAVATSERVAVIVCVHVAEIGTVRCACRLVDPDGTITAVGGL